MHEVTVPCVCGDVENCLTERYISDVRIAQAELAALYGALKRLCEAIYGRGEDEAA